MWRDKKDILRCDERFHNLQKNDPKLGYSRPLKIEDLHDDVAHLMLPASVPDDITRQFDLARNAYIYSWFDYEMATLAEAHSYSVVEMAIKHRVKHDKSGKKPAGQGLTAAIKHAKVEKWLNQRDFDYVANGETKSRLYDLIKMRNSLAHGEPHLFPSGSIMLMEWCYEIIVALFQE
ncbi:hypothetical protein [Agrobacterium vitis]|uniref:RiboL-PSP-HEPN domain-containing protein n=1 Tax=Agrobacterium vitis TaxID=373 RepID=A0A7K1RM73_AGRVI|nr:hypothetical protein [Agrobacterium vitis]MVA59143.1 hypothetical protein [Agrobacterium vitis]